MPDNLLAPDRIKTKIGKLPIWAWGLIGGTAALGSYYLFAARKRARTPNAGVNPAPGDNTLASVFTGMATPDQTANAALPVDGYTGSNLSTSNALGEATLETNLTWLNRGIKLSGAGFLNATTALQKYLGGKPLTDSEQTTVSKVLATIGYPPEGAPLLVKAIKDATPTPAKKVTPKVTKDTPVVTPVVKPVVTPKAPDLVSTLGEDGYPLNAQGKQIVTYSNEIPLKIFGGKFDGYQVNLNYLPNKYQYVKVNKPWTPTIPAIPTH
jgi:hypothetical protein